MEITATVVGVVIGLVTIIGFFSKFIITQTRMSVQLAQIQKELIELKDMMKDRDTDIDKLKEQVTEIRLKCKFIQDNKKGK